MQVERLRWTGALLSHGSYRPCTRLATTLLTMEITKQPPYRTGSIGVRWIETATDELLS